MATNKKIDLDKLSKETLTGTQVGALIESFDYKLSSVAEGVSMLSNKFDKLAQSQEELVERMERVEVKLDATFEAVGDIKIELTGLREKDEDLDRRVVVLEKRAVI